MLAVVYDLCTLILAISHKDEVKDMPTLPPEIITFLSIFVAEFTKSTWKNMLHLIQGAILCRGARRITTILHVLGLSQQSNFSKYHRVLSRAKYNSINLSKILFGLIIPMLPDSWPILIAADETLERRKGKKIRAKGCYRDAVRSSQSTVVKSFGLKWECMVLIVPLPFCQRPWALPFMTVLSPSEKANTQAGKAHKTSIDWTIIMMKLVCRWLGSRTWYLIGDGAYACTDLALACISKKVALVSRLRLDAQLYEFPDENPPKKRGRKRLKGERIRLADYLDDKTQDWLTCEVSWYGGQKKIVNLLSKVCLWYQAGKPPITLRYVLVVDPEDKYKPEVFFSTDSSLAAETIIEYFVLRWNIEITFEETRTHLGVETQRQWSDKAIARTTPLLMGLYSLVTLLALELSTSYQLTPLSTAWYQKNGNVTFSDVIAFVRRIIWARKYFSKSVNQSDFVKIDKNDFFSLINQLASSG